MLSRISIGISFQRYLHDGVITLLCTVIIVNCYCCLSIYYSSMVSLIMKQRMMITFQIKITDVRIIWSIVFLTSRSALSLMSLICWWATVSSSTAFAWKVISIITKSVKSVFSCCSLRLSKNSVCSLRPFAVRDISTEALSNSDSAYV